MVKVIAEIGCNHKGDFKLAKEMIKVAANDCGVDIVKFQKRNNKELLGEKGYNLAHPNPDNSYGKTYGLHRDYLEFNMQQHKELKEYCENQGVIYSVSVWDIISTKEVVLLNPEFIKIPSATNLNFKIHSFLAKKYKGKIHISMGMTSMKEIESIVKFYEKYNRLESLVIYSCTSGYPVPAEDLCLLEIDKLMKIYGARIDSYGFSGHHNGIAPDIAAYTIGFLQNTKPNTNFDFIERHFTLDRTWKGTDHAASLEPSGLKKLVRDLKNVSQALNYKKVDILEIEISSRKKLKDIVAEEK